MRDRIIVKGKNTIFDLELRGRITIIDGDSGKGKTFLCNLLQDKIILNTDEFKDIVVINYLTKDRLDSINRYKGKLIVIDNADVILDKEQVGFINSDRENQYIIMTRLQYDFNISPNYIAQLTTEDFKTFYLKYEYSVKGWF